MQTRRLWRLALATVFVVAACAHNNPDVEELYEARPDPIPVHVKNENFLDMNVAIVSGGMTRRLGSVTGNGSANFSINWSVANGQTVSLTATPIGASTRPWLSQGLSVHPGQTIEVHIASVLRQSNAIVRE